MLNLIKVEEMFVKRNNVCSIIKTKGTGLQNNSFYMCMEKLCKCFIESFSPGGLTDL